MTAPEILAIAQTVPSKGDVAENVGRHVDLLSHAPDNALVLFPELSLTGYELGDAGSLAFAMDGTDARLAPLRDVVANKNMTVVIGAPIRTSHGLHIGAFIFGPGGRNDYYTKRRLGAFPDSARDHLVEGHDHLPPPESDVFVRLDHDPTLQLGERRCSLAICADVGHPTHAVRAAECGAGVYLASMFLIPDDHDGETSRLCDISRRHRMAVAVANFGGPSGGLASAGRSQFIADGNVVSVLPESGAGLLLAREGEDVLDVEQILPA